MARLTDAVAASDDDLDLTLIRVQALSGAKDGEALLRALDGAVRDWAAGAPAGRLDDGAFGVLHGRDRDPERLLDGMRAAAGARGIEAAGFALDRATLPMDSRDLAPEQLRGALRQIIHGFVAAAGHAIGLRCLSEGRDQARTLARRRIDRAIEALLAGRAAVASRPILDLHRHVSVARRLVLAPPPVDNDIGSLDEALAQLEPDDVAALDSARVAAAADFTALSSDGGGHVFVLDIRPESLTVRAFAEGLPALLTARGLRPADALLRVPALSRRGNPGKSLTALSPLLRAGLRICVADVRAALDGIGHLAGGDAGFVEVPMRQVNLLVQETGGEEMLTRLLSVWRGVGVSALITGIATPQHAHRAASLGASFGAGPLFEHVQLG
ncbi:MAG: EAL domain-containing protein [Alphaproteobacteria bacterium]